VAKIRLNEPLNARSLEIKKSCLVIGGGVSGMTAALAVARQGYEVFLVEKEPELGGGLRNLYYMFDGEDPQAELRRLKRDVQRHERIHLFLGATIQGIEGSIGDFRTKLAVHGVSGEIHHGVVIVATGAAPHRPAEYLYGEHPAVLTQGELEERLATNTNFLAVNGRKTGKTVVMIQCVGSRCAERPYCSRVCCAEAIKNALKIKAAAPKTNVYVLYRDVRTYGFKESYYTQARQQGVVFLRFEEKQKPEVVSNRNGLEVYVQDQTLEMPVLIKADLVVLSAATVANPGNKELAQLLKVPLNEDGFFLEAHRKLRPIDFATDGIYLCGAAHSPMTVGEAIAQASGAAAHAASVLSRDAIDLEPTISHVVEEKCDGCAYCVDPCPYKAITLVEYISDGEVKKRVQVNEAVCKGCGTCQATCPKGAIFVWHFRPEQLTAEVHAALNVE
jgi:heterodisulfide reductase subunit A